MAPCMCHPHFTECAPGPREVKGVARVPQQPGRKLSWFQPTTPSHLLGARPWQCGVRETKTCHQGAKPGSPDIDILKQRHGRPRCLPPRHWPPGAPALQPLLPASWPHPAPQPLLPAAWPRPAPQPLLLPAWPSAGAGWLFQFRVVSKSSAILQLLNMRR